MNKRLFTFLLGVIVVVILAELMFVERHTDKDDYYDLFASFNKVDGVSPGDKIMVSGISVGYVKEVYLNKNYPSLRMKIKKDLDISDDSSVSIQTDGLFGSKFLMIEMGGTSKFLKNGDYFSFTEDSILIQDLLENIIKIGEKNKLSKKTTLNQF